jgi:hypothetical protein
VVDDLGDPGSRQQRRIQVPRRWRRQDDRQFRRKLTQRRREIQREVRAGLMAYERGVESRRHGAGLRCLLQPSEADGFIAERRQNLLVPQQPPAVCLKHQHRLTDPATNRARRTLNEYRLMGWGCGKPDVEACSAARGAAHVQGALVFSNDVEGGGESKTVAFWTRGEKRLENPLQCCLVHAAPRDRRSR